MKITKIGHCCLLIEVDGKRILTDPGMFTVGEHELENIDVVLYTHEHGDHFHLESLKEIVTKNDSVTIISNATVGKLLEEAGIAYEVLEGSEAREIKDVLFTAHDAPHAVVFENLADVHNTGYFITERFFYPGDAYAVPEKSVEILALPVAGPWCELEDVIQYALNVQPKVAFPVHDGLLNEDGLAIHHRIVGSVLPERGVEFRAMTAGDTEEF